ncbi:hypothetical protein HWV62_42771 [Athelia sp. TMB]|nr:hypothetical protein HWV62_42771 [Athelia sp. TMB]
MPSTPQTIDILVFTYPEAGQATTILSLVSELLSRPDPLTITVASFAELAPRVARLQPQVQPGSALHFRAIVGVSEMDAIWRSGLPPDGNQHPPLTRSSYAFELIPLLLCPWTDAEFEETTESCKSALRDMKPDVIVMDMVFHQAIDACTALGAKYIVNTCMPPLGTALAAQPHARAFWYYPSSVAPAPFPPNSNPKLTCAPFPTPSGGSGIPFPVPWTQIPTNIWLTLRWAYTFLTDARAKKASGFRFRPDVPYLCQGLRELEYPLAVPPNMTLTGPLLAPPPPLDAAGELGAWLGRGETVLFMMGTHYAFTEELARTALAGILAGVRGRAVQVLWKLPAHERFAGVIAETLRKFDCAPDAVRAASWLDAEITSILSHPNLTCFIHHGGANSYFESAYCGVPQIILPQWFDLYDNATRVAYLGIGACGSARTAPGLSTSELAEAVARVTGTPSYRERAEALGRVCRAKGGRARAAEFVLERGAARFSAMAG